MTTKRRRINITLLPEVINYYKDNVAWEERVSFSRLIEIALKKYRPMEHE